MKTLEEILQEYFRRKELIMQDFVKIVNPCKYDNGYEEYNAFAKISYKDGRLSISGVIGPMRNGDSKGSAGQCYDEISEGTPNEKQGWTSEMLDKFIEIWEEWHLNDMRPYCKHMKELGWDELAKEKIEVRTYTLNHEGSSRQRECKDKTVQMLKEGKTFTPSYEEVMYANLPYSVTTYDDEPAVDMELYEFKLTDCIGQSNIEYKSRGWIRADESELGILCKPCPVCGYKYGTKWLIEEVPEDVLEFLYSLPESVKKPAWV